MPPATRQLSTADARREEVLEAAMAVFAERGFRGASTSEVARTAGLSQAYVFKLFPTKDELVVAVVDRCHDRTLEAFEVAAKRARAEGVDVLEAMGQAYVELLADRHALLGQLQAHAAAVTDPGVREAVRRGFAQMYDYVSSASGAGDDEVRAWFATGMLLNVLAAMDAPAVDAEWARVLLGD